MAEKYVEIETVDPPQIQRWQESLQFKIYAERWQAYMQEIFEENNDDINNFCGLEILNEEIKMTI